MFIISPLFGGMSKMFSTHPPVEQRIAKLQEIATVEDSLFSKWLVIGSVS